MSAHLYDPDGTGTCPACPDVDAPAPVGQSHYAGYHAVRDAIAARMDREGNWGDCYASQYAHAAMNDSTKLIRRLSDWAHMVPADAYDPDPAHADQERVNAVSRGVRAAMEVDGCTVERAGYDVATGQARWFIRRDGVITGTLWTTPGTGEMILRLATGD